MTPTQRSLKELRARGYVACIVEKWNSFAKIRQDFAGFADILAFKAGENGVLAIQATSTPNVSARITKTQSNPNVSVWKAAGNRFAVWGFALRGERGKRKTYQLREIEL